MHIKYYRNKARNDYVRIALESESDQYEASSHLVREFVRILLGYMNPAEDQKIILENRHKSIIFLDALAHLLDSRSFEDTLELRR
jgi:hypothetical protein